MKYCYVIIRGIKADDESMSNSCVPVDLFRRSPSARPSLYSLKQRWNEDVTSSSDASGSSSVDVPRAVIAVLSTRAVTPLEMSISTVLCRHSDACCRGTLRFWYRVLCLVPCLVTLCVALVWRCSSIAGSELSLQNVVGVFLEVMNCWWIWRWWTLLNCGVSNDNVLICSCILFTIYGFTWHRQTVLVVSGWS